MTRLPAAQRKEQLLDRAAELFARHGYARATTAELARAAGVTEPILYRHFDSKRDLFVALIVRAGQRTIETWEHHLAGAADAAERLKRLLGDNPMVTPEGRHDYLVLLQAITEVDDTPIHDAITTTFRNLHGFLRREIERAQADHKVTSRYSGELIAWLLIHIGLGYGSLSALRVEGQGMDASGSHVQDMLTRLLIGRASDRRPEDAA
ncbi:MAG: TetR/AcrR family transcriptional regulator [Phycisphaeraceae bacterium]|nr:TetR/AcrR family transcriptional regulator [Phycisphaerae bacterium]MBX3391026.1 TetR/AcrR family transcriptional regulator [Phycisphaeraceae bacterium]